MIVGLLRILCGQLFFLRLLFIRVSLVLYVLLFFLSAMIIIDNKHGHDYSYIQIAKMQVAEYELSGKS